MGKGESEGTGQSTKEVKLSSKETSLSMSLFLILPKAQRLTHTALQLHGRCPFGFLGCVLTVCPRILL